MQQQDKPARKTRRTRRTKRGKTTDVLVDRTSSSVIGLVQYPRAPGQPRVTGEIKGNGQGKNAGIWLKIKVGD